MDRLSHAQNTLKDPLWTITRHDKRQKTFIHKNRLVANFIFKYSQHAMNINNMLCKLIFIFSCLSIVGFWYFALCLMVFKSLKIIIVHQKLKNCL